MSLNQISVTPSLRSALLALCLVLGGTGAICANAATPSTTWANGLQSADKVKLTDDHVERFIATVKELKTLENEFSVPDRLGNGDWEAAFAANAQANGVLQRHGFADGEAFKNTAYSIAIGFANLEMAKNQVEMEQVKAQLAAMKDQMTPETYAMIEKQLLGTMTMLDDQPAGNIDVIRKYREQLEFLDADE